MAKQPYVIVVLEDDPLVNSTVKSVLEESYSEVHVFSDAKEAIETIDDLRPDLLLLDIFLGHYNGLEILQELRDNGHQVPVIMMTAFSDIRMAVRAMRLGAEDFIVKPLDLEQLELTVERALEKYELKRQVDVLSERLETEQPDEVIGVSDGIKAALEVSRIVANADTTALILGETGTGKELFARYIHKNSQRSKGPFITINCGAIPKELAENELFGYEKGAFTGATEKVKQGRFEQAHRGTILLDEVGELGLDLQVKLLRVLQERKYYRLGGLKEISVDVRVIAATNQNLERLVEEGKFREDLYYRLNVATIDLPSLRNRTEDIIPIASSFIKEFNSKFSKSITGFTPEAVNILQNYYWKGNIRELRNVIERVMLLESQSVISKESLAFLKPSSTPASLQMQLQKQKPIELESGEHLLHVSKEGALWNNVVKDLILQTLKITEGNQIQAAKVLNISRAKLRYRIEQLNIKVTNNFTSTEE
ncbi:MAG: sigma-54-dependent Fis family transcriptional regulator [Candidatus Kapabacteria bacterium]|nr:sigma-54-dependent Fis family transcriptional regulator [Candidatus Kapabacteria bacterium]